MNCESEFIRNFKDNLQLCRLCSSTNNLIDLFSESVVKCNFYRKLFVYATGIEIKKDDIVSKMVCQSCCEIAIKLHKYRTNALTNDKSLKLQTASKPNHEIYHEANPFSIINAVQHFNLTIKKELTDQIDPFQNIDEHVQQAEPSFSKISRKTKYHSSIRKLLFHNPRLIISDEICTEDVSPAVTLNKADVTKWYEEQIHKVKQKLGNITIKKLTVNSHDSVINSYVIKKPAQIRCPANRDKRKVVKEGPITNKPDSSLSASLDNVNVLKISCTANNKTKLTKTPQIVNEIHTKADLQNPNSTSTIGTVSVSKDSLPKSAGIKKITSLQETDDLDSNPQSDKEEYIIFRDEADTTIPVITDAVLDEPKSKTVRNKRSSSEAFQTTAKNMEQKSVVTAKKRIRSAVSMSKTGPPAASKEVTSLKASVAPEYDTLFIINSSKSVEVFVCPTCSLVCESKKILTQHQKTHLLCQVCKTKFKNLALLEAHVLNHCLMNNIQDNAVITVVRVDTIPSMIEKYSDAFQNCLDQDRLNKDSFLLDECNIKCEDDIEIKYENLELENKENTVAAVAVPELKSEIDYVCISDDSDNDIECSIVSSDDQFSVQNPNYMYRNGMEFDVTNKNFYYISKLHKSEDDMLESLYKKHYLPRTVQNYVQTFKPTNNIIKCTVNNIIILKDMFTELLAYKIPIHLEYQAKIGAYFSQPFVKKKAFFEYWGHKKVIDVLKSPASEPAVTDVLPSQVANVISSDVGANELPFKIVDVSTDTSCAADNDQNVASSSSTATSAALDTTSSLQQLHSDNTTINTNGNDLPSNIPAPVENINSKLNKVSFSNSQIFSIASGQDFGMMPKNGIIINSLPASSGQNSIVLSNNLFVVSNPRQPILCNANFTVPINVSTNSGIDKNDTTKISEVEEIIDID